VEIRQNCWMCPVKGSTPDTGGHLYINTVKNVYHCKRCDARGVWEPGAFPVEQWVRTKTDYSFVDLYRWDKKTPYLKGNTYHNKVKEYTLARLPEEIVLERTKWSPQIVNRVFFPVYSEGKVAMWQGRSIDDSKPRYLSHGNVSHYLYNLEYTTDDWCTLCEGPFDALASPNGVALFGKSISEVQSMILTSKFKTIYWALDGDTSKQKRVAEQKHNIKQFVKVIDVPMGVDEDPSSIGMEGMKEKIWQLSQPT